MRLDGVFYELAQRDHSITMLSCNEHPSPPPTRVPNAFSCGIHTKSCSGEYSSILCLERETILHLFLGSFVDRDRLLVVLAALGQRDMNYSSNFVHLEE